MTTLFGHTIPGTGNKNKSPKNPAKSREPTKKKSTDAEDVQKAQVKAMGGLKALALITAPLDMAGYADLVSSSASETATPEDKAKALKALHDASAKGVKRVILAEQEIPLNQDWFYCKQTGKSYGIQADWIQLFGQKRSIIIYDVNFFEALSISDSFGGMEPHWSQRSDQILRLGFVRQTVGQGQNQPAGNSNWIDWAIKIGLGVLIGYFLGQSLPLSSFTHSNVGVTNP